MWNTIRASFFLLWMSVFFSPALAAPEQSFFRIATGAAEGVYFETGGELASILSVPAGSRPCAQGGPCGVPGLLVVAQTTQGSVENIQLLASGHVEAALVQADLAVAAVKGQAPFMGKPLSGVRLLMPLYAEAVHIIVRADSKITSVRQLRGKRVAVGEPLSGTGFLARAVLNAAGLKSGQYTADTSRAQPALAALKAGTLDAVVMVGRVPFPRLTEAADAAALRFLAVDGKVRQRLVQKAAALQAFTLPAGSYSGQAAAVETVAVPMLFLVREDIADAQAQAIARVLNRPENLKKLAAEAPVSGAGVPLHKGLLVP